MKKVLFFCVHNSARSQMAEALLKQRCGGYFQVASAGMEPGALNPLAVQVMEEIGIDISHNRAKDIFPFIRERPGYNYVISVCDKRAGQHCPVFPAGVRRIEWDFPDPASFTGSEQEKLAQARELRDAIKARIDAWCAEICMPEAVC